MLRHAFRTNIRLNLDIVQATGRCLECDLETALIFAAVLAGNASTIEESPSLSRQYATGPAPDGLRRPMRVQGLAESLKLPRETTRYKAADMVRRGLLEATDAGLIVPSATLASERLTPLYIAHLGSLGRCIEQLALAGIAELASNERLAPLPFPSMWGAMRAVTRHVLRGVDDLNAFTRPGSLLQAYLMLAILDHSAWASGGQDRVLYAEDQTPPSARALVTAQGLAKSLELPRETVRRNMKALVKSGHLTQERDGFAVSETVRGLETDRERHVQSRVHADMIRLVRQLRNVDALVTV
jgi:hypothetical protein